MSENETPTSGTPTPETTPTPAATPTFDPITDKLKPLGVEDAVIEKIKSDLGAATVEDLIGLTVDDLTGAGMKVLPARKLVGALVPAKAEVTPSGLTAVRAAMPTVRLQDLPQPSNWLASLCAVQPLRIPPVIVVTGIKAAMADVFGFFQLTRKMQMMLREAAENVGEGVPQTFFDLQDLTLARRYGALVSWMKGKSSACTAGERNRFLTRAHGIFWDAIDAFYTELDTWRQGRRDSQDMGEAMATAFSGEIQIYDTTPVRNAALAFGHTMNKAFAGTGVYAATALQLDNDELQNVLQGLDYRQFGVASREQLLDQLGCSVPPDIMAAETTIGKFVWNAILVKDQAAGSSEEQRFLIELASIGGTRPWNQVKALASQRKKERPSSGLTGIGGRGRDLEEEDEI